MAELGTTTDPTALVPGSAEGVAGVITSWRGARDAAGQLSEAIFAVSPASSWTGNAAEAFELRRTAAADAWAALRDCLDAAVQAVETYAETLTWAQQQAAEAIALWQEGQEATTAARATPREQERTAGPTTILPHFVDTGQSSRAAARDLLSKARVELARVGDAADDQVRAARELAPEKYQWALLSAGGPALQIWRGTPKAVTDKLLLSVLNRLSRADPEQIEELLELHPEWAELLATRPPDAEAVNSWWDSLTDPAVQQALVAGAPALIGSLAGIPPLVRVAANRENAADRLDVIDDLAAEPGIGDDERAELEAERTYLQRAVDGDVQLYLYDPDSHSIIEMVGTPSENTTTTVTYVPGTFTNMESFYAADGGPQEVSHWLNERDQGIVTFVWKEGAFPGGDEDDSVVDGLIEANDLALATEEGALLADFQSGMLASNDYLAGTQQVAMGHSWGLAPIAASELAGAQYDQVHSLAGAGMPADWAADPNTSYSHWAYTDALTMAQETGFVWGGNIPLNDPAFSSEIYAREGDFDLPLPAPAAPGTHGMAEPGPTMPATTTPIENHNLIASDEFDNLDALDDMLRRIRE